MRTRRPFSVTLLSVLVLILGVTNLVRLVLGIQRYELLTSLLPFSPAYTVVSGLFWSAIAFPLAWGVWSGRNWARRLTPIALLAYSIYYWMDRLLLVNNPLSNINWPFAITINFFIILWSVWVCTRPKAKSHFGE